MHMTLRKKQNLARAKRAFTLLEMMVALFILTLVGTLVSVQVSKLIRAHRFEKEVSYLLTAIQEAQVLAVTYQTDIALDFRMEKGKLEYLFSSDEPFAKAIFHRQPVPLSVATSLHFNKKRAKTVHLDIYSSGTVEPQGVLTFSAGQEDGKFDLDFSRGSLIKLVRRSSDLIASP